MSSARAFLRECAHEFGYPTDVVPESGIDGKTCSGPPPHGCIRVLEVPPEKARRAPPYFTRLKKVPGASQYLTARDVRAVVLGWRAPRGGRGPRARGRDVDAGCCS